MVVDLARERLKRRPVQVIWRGRRYRVTRPLWAAWLRWWRS